jgi:hypothetical protein
VKLSLVLWEHGIEGRLKGSIRLANKSLNNKRDL